FIFFLFCCKNFPCEPSLDLGLKLVRVSISQDFKIRTSIDFGFEFSEFDGFLLDYSWQCGNQDTMEKLLELAEAAHLKEKIGKMYSGEHINNTEDISVLHVALRAPRDAVMSSDGINESLTDWSHGEVIERCCSCWNWSLGDWLQEGLIHSHCNSLSRRNPQDQPSWFRDCRVVDVVNMMPTPKGGTMELLYMQVLQSHPLQLKHFVPAYDLDMDFVLGVGGYDLDRFMFLTG
ncbi:hypothetical protein C5167_046502, partial [Papaver somniferum]